MFSNWLTSSSLSTSTPPPDVILEIGPSLPITRFAAHSTLLAAHSGYMRSALLRPEERITDCRPIYVPNIAAEHFAPLLTYMYTGFLDLTIDNIFGVLLATHVLHMPRALEICRSFLARVQSDGYSTSGYFSMQSMVNSKTLEKSSLVVPSRSSISDGVKIVRPIASKATNNTGLAFVAPPISKPLFSSHDTPFKSLHLPTRNNGSNSSITDRFVTESEASTEKRERSSPTASTSHTLQVGHETFPRKQEMVLTGVAKKPFKLRKRRDDKVKLLAKSPVIEVAALETAPNISDGSDVDKIVIDVASCDGPVRFQRVLNDAYGRFPIKNSEMFGGASVAQTNHIERKRSHVANSFHLQMARNISERQSMDSAADSENSEEIVVHDAAAAATTMTTKSETSVRNNCKSVNNIDSIGNGAKSDEVYSCVYCKHTFKSQYCYQKHAKRHINPLAVDGELVVDTSDSINSEKDDKSNNSITTPLFTAVAIAAPSASAANSSVSVGVKREVRPLDMNVQYYPCKTCGSKFPSYYFVHKHRKMCHADDEN